MFDTVARAEVSWARIADETVAQTFLDRAADGDADGDAEDFARLVGEPVGGRRRSTAVRLLAIAAMGASAALALPATAAQATPLNCWSGPWNGNDGWQGKCDTITNPGTDRYRAVAYCVRENGSRRTAYGPWVSSIPYPVSVAVCPVNYSASSGYLQTG